MELIYFILGFLFTVTGYGVVLLYKTKSSHTVLLEKLQSQSNISSLREAEVIGNIEDLSMTLNDIQVSMKKDQYKSLSDINKRINNLDQVTTSINSNLKESNRVFTKNISTAMTKYQHLQTQVKQLGQDPNMTSRY